MAGNIISIIRKKDEEILRLNKRVLDESPDLIAVIGIDYIYNYVNPSYCGAHGLSKKDLTGKHVKDFVGEDTFNEIVKPKMDRCLHGEDIRYEEWFDFPEMGERFMDLRYMPLPNSSGIVDRIVVILRDMTSIKQAESTARNEEKLKTVVELAGTYNHEINNPLCAVRGYLELIDQSSDDEMILEFVTKALTEIDRIADVTHKLAEATSISLTDYPGGETIIDIQTKNENYTEIIESE